MPKKVLQNAEKTTFQNAEKCFLKMPKNGYAVSGRSPTRFSSYLVPQMHKGSHHLLRRSFSHGCRIFHCDFIFSVKIKYYSIFKPFMNKKIKLFSNSQQIANLADFGMPNPQRDQQLVVHAAKLIQSVKFPFDRFFVCCVVVCCPACTGATITWFCAIEKAECMK